MKQYCYPTSKKYKSIDTCLNKDEIDVAGILVDLPNLIPQSEARGRGEVPVSWGVRKKRSVPAIRAVVEEKPQPQPRGKTVESTSPSTPLSFYPTESLSDHKSNLKKRTREDLLEEIDGLRETRKLLTRQVENERTRFEKLKSLNLALKDKKLEANSFGFGLRREKSGLGIIGNQNLNLELKLDQQQYYPNTTIFGYQQQQQQQMIINHSIYDSSKAAAAASGMFQFPQFLSSNGGGGLSVNQAAPHGIPDLNIGLEEAYGLETFQPLDHSRVLVDDRVMCAAEARRRRMIKMKEIKKRQQPQRVR